MSGQGVSDSHIERIAERVVQRNIAPLQRDVSRLDARLDQFDSRLDRLEQEMANVEGAVRQMHEGLKGELRDIQSGNKELLHVQKRTQDITREQFVMANAQIGTTNNNLTVLNATSVSGFMTVSSGIDRMAQAVVQTEVIRLLHEAKEPTDRVTSFAEEIEQRFAKTVENVWFVRSQYDQLLATVMTEYERKLRVIGEHIYRVYDEDFREWAEVPLSEPAARSVELPIGIDERRIAHRTEALDGRFASLGDEVIEPLLSAHRELEHTLASRFSCQVSTAGGEEVAIPVAVCVREQSGVQVLGSVRPTVTQGEAGARLELVETQASVKPPVSSSGGMSQLKTTMLSTAEIGTLKEALARLAAEGRIDGSILAGYHAYLDQFGLATIADQNVKGL
jgi:uncharacterized protein (UPF0335 family)